MFYVIMPAMLKKILIFICISTVSVSLSSCAFVTEVSKTIWGSSIRHLENARQDALSASFQCSVEECFEAVLMIVGQEKEKTVEIVENQERNFYGNDGKNEEGVLKKELAVTHLFDVFIKNRVKQHIVVMGISGNIDTTEVGIFFDEMENVVKIDISSLSTSAKRTVAKAVFEALTLQFTKVHE